MPFPCRCSHAIVPDHHPHPRKLFSPQSIPQPGKQTLTPNQPTPPPPSSNIPPSRGHHSPRSPSSSYSHTAVLRACFPAACAQRRAIIHHPRNMHRKQRYDRGDALSGSTIPTPCARVPTCMLPEKVRDLCSITPHSRYNQARDRVRSDEMRWNGRGKRKRKRRSVLLTFFQRKSF